MILAGNEIQLIAKICGVEPQENRYILESKRVRKLFREILNVIISLQKKSEAVLALSIIYWIICIGSYLLFLRAVRSLAQQHREYLQKKMEIKLMKKQINDSVQLSNEYASLRKWNHDIENHIMSVMYLMDMKKYEEAETYTASVLSRINCRPQEKQPEEDCSHEKEH